jgi:hypothetical protein
MQERRAKEAGLPQEAVPEVRGRKLSAFGPAAGPLNRERADVVDPLRKMLTGQVDRLQEVVNGLRGLTENAGGRDAMDVAQLAVEIKASCRRIAHMARFLEPNLFPLEPPRRFK